jgi:hypothetical protein
MTVEEIRRIYMLATCHHEAAHVAAAWRFGQIAESMQLGTIFGGSGDFNGLSEIMPILALENIVSVEQGVGCPVKLSPANAIIWYAGRVGHNRYLSTALGRKCCALQSHFKHDLDKVRRVTTDRRLMAEYRNRAEHMVAENWAVIQKLTCALYDKKRLEREDIEKIIARAKSMK